MSPAEKAARAEEDRILDLEAKLMAARIKAGIAAKEQAEEEARKLPVDSSRRRYISHAWGKARGSGQVFRSHCGR